MITRKKWTHPPPHLYVAACGSRAVSTAAPDLADALDRLLTRLPASVDAAALTTVLFDTLSLPVDGLSRGQPGVHPCLVSAARRHRKLPRRPWQGERGGGGASQEMTLGSTRRHNMIRCLVYDLGCSAQSA
jgi:hypothetical protein